ncbi:MAG: PEP/pyruvate-binding domain-containing protein [Bacteroidota bacterium]|nr:PEP/pyruvate-binding domain-containing protein [Bacteroidota bacterium]
MKSDEQKNNEKTIYIEHKERLKELSAINKTISIIKEGKPIDETLYHICKILPQGWQYPEHTVCRIIYDEKDYSSPGFKETKWCQREAFETNNFKKCVVEIFYNKEFEEFYEGPFLKEERDLISNITNIIIGFLNSSISKKIHEDVKLKKDDIEIKETPSTSLSNRKLLQTFLNKNNSSRDLYHDLMPFKVKEILLVANLYDAFSIESEGRFSEHVLGEYHQLNLTSLPRITGVTSEEEIIEYLEAKHFDMIIFMVGVDKKMPIKISENIKKRYPYIPLFLLFNNNSDLALFKHKKLPFIEKIFVWNGDSNIFFAMIKYVEDKINIENDTKLGHVRVILLVEDSEQFYSRYLPLLYQIVLKQTKRIIDDVSTDELYKVLRLRARPKIILVSDYEKAIEIFEKYKDFMLCLITDVKYPRNGVIDENAGFSLVKEIKKQSPELPTIIQSSNPENADKAYELKSIFIDKNSESLTQDFRSFITHFLGFGNFIYRNKSGRKIAEAKSLKEFEMRLKTIPDESLVYHGKKNHFSLWLMARGEIQVAKVINPAKTSDFTTPDELRQYLIEKISIFRNEQNTGKVIPFEETAILDETNIVGLTDGAMGGKGRGLAFINNLINNFDFSKMVEDINIRSPKTAIIGTDEFEFFMEHNKLADFVLETDDYDIIKERFIQSELSEGLKKKLKKLLQLIDKPIAVRSSGLLEDSLTQPFAGIFATYLLPNNNPNIKVRIKQCMDAIKLVFSSVFSKTAKGYINAVNYKIEEEKMAVVIQEVVGTKHDEMYYPHFSGVSQSYNYYPFGYIKPEDGFSVAAMGLGRYVVEGEKAFRFCQKYPDLVNNTPVDQYKESQLYFYAVNLENKDLNLLTGEDAGLVKSDISVAEKQGTLKHCASVFDNENERIIPGIDSYGPRIVNFANILKYNYIPLSKTIEAILDIGKEAMGSPIEIEFSVDLTKDKDGKASFYILQIKPLIGSARDYEINLNEINKEKILLQSIKGMGNGKISDIQDVVFINPEIFEKSKTEEMALEVENLNNKMTKEGRKYILIGPGRWGTRDKWIGIPVSWPQISNAKVIVETNFEDYPLDSSSGSHFFHNVTSMNVGYFSVHQNIDDNFINWKKLKKQKIINQEKFFTQIRFEKPLTVRMDGKKGISVITFE